MDLTQLKKKISSYRTPAGKITRVPDELAYEILLAWEEWSGPASGFYKQLGLDFRKAASLMGRAKKLKRDGVFTQEQFKEVKVAEAAPYESSSSAVVVLRWGTSRVLEFSRIDHVVEFFKKTEPSAQSQITPELKLQKEDEVA